MADDGTTPRLDAMESEERRLDDEHEDRWREEERQAEHAEALAEAEYEHEMRERDRRDPYDFGDGFNYDD